MQSFIAKKRFVMKRLNSMNDNFKADFLLKNNWSQEKEGLVAFSLFLLVKPIKPSVLCFPSEVFQEFFGKKITSPS